VILEILDIVEFIILLIIPIALCGFLLFLGMRIVNKKESMGQHFKVIFCIAITFGIIFSIILVMAVNIYQVAMIWEEYELTKPADPVVKQLSFMAVEFVWQMIGVGLMCIVWHIIYFHQLIPGTGTAKERLKASFKESIKNLKVRKK